MAQSNVKISCGRLPKGALTKIWNIQGNIWHACAIKYIDNVDSRLNFLNCMINNNYNPYKAALRYISTIIDPEMLQFLQLWCTITVLQCSTRLEFFSPLWIALWRHKCQQFWTSLTMQIKSTCVQPNVFPLDILSEMHSRTFASWGCVWFKFPFLQVLKEKHCRLGQHLELCQGILRSFRELSFCEVL